MKLSIVTVCYNAEQCIDRTIKSVLNQTCPVYEYIIIDGGSKDKTYNRVCSYEKSLSTFQKETKELVMPLIKE